MSLNGPSCHGCTGKRFYDISLSSTGINITLNRDGATTYFDTGSNPSTATTDFGFGKVQGVVVADSVFLAGNKVSHGAYWLKEGALMVTEVPRQ